MRILVTGAEGFVGQHLVNELTNSGHEILALDIAGSPLIGDICDAEFLLDLVNKYKPEACIHLAGIAYVPTSWEKPNKVFTINLNGTINLLEAFRHHAPKARILLISSAEVYGTNDVAELITETTRLQPQNPYAISKMSAEQMALLYAERYDMQIIISRPDNHIGPGQSPSFVVPAFAKQLVEMVNGNKEKLIKVGNLECERDFVDVRDVVRAYRMLIETAPSKQTYNVARGKPEKIGTILERLCSIAGITPKIEICPTRYRPTDQRPILDITKISQEINWNPQIPLETTLKDIYAALLE